MKRSVDDENENYSKRLRSHSPEEELGIDSNDVYIEEQEFETSVPIQKINLFNVFSHSNDHKERNPLVSPVCRVCNSIIDEEEAMVLLSCQFCSHVGCSHCTPQCFSCGDRFCKNCSLQNYELTLERTICIDCNCSYQHAKWSP
jgi:hypothetical protein